MVTREFRLAVVGTDGQVTRDLGAAGRGLLNGLIWAPDGGTSAVAHTERSRDKGSLSIVLRHPGAVEKTTLYEYSEQAPPWYDAEEHRFGDARGAFNSWWTPRLTDLQWAPDSPRLASPWPPHHKAGTTGPGTCSGACSSATP